MYRTPKLPINDGRVEDQELFGDLLERGGFDSNVCNT